MNPLFLHQPTTVFERMSGLARAHGAINLGQGFPEQDGPLELRREAGRALEQESNQYPPLLGLSKLRQAVAEHYLHFQGVRLDPEREITITSGATEALAAALFALVSQGDEVVVFEPLYDAYLPLVRRAGGVPRIARLHPPEFRLTREVLSRVFSSKTRVVLFNTPANPSARVYEREELELLAEFVERSGAWIVSDEVWEQLVFAGGDHLSLLGLDVLRDRCVKIGSAGKMFSLTGWKLGFVCASPELSRVVAQAHQFLTFCSPPHLQHAVAWGLRELRPYLAEQTERLSRSRARLACGLTRAGYVCLPSQGSYFLSVDLAASGISLPDEEFCLRAVEVAKVAAIPFSAFYAQDPVRHLVRLCFAKSDETLDRAVQRLGEARSSFEG